MFHSDIPLKAKSAGFKDAYRDPDPTGSGWEVYLNPL